MQTTIKKPSLGGAEAGAMHYASEEVNQRLDKFEERLANHYAMQELGHFGKHLAAAPLDYDGLRTFFATLSAFFKHSPAGIMALALRITDDWMERDRYNATSKGGYILFADVDEYGLNELPTKGMQPTHHQLFLRLSQHLGVTEEDLHSPRYILPSGTEIGELNIEYYRQRTIGNALGFHLASETTSSREFVYFLKGFQAYKDVYKLESNRDPVLEFFRVHTLVEPLHKAMGRSIIDIYSQENPDIFYEVEQGALAFMEGFGNMFRDLNNTIFDSSVAREQAVA